MTKINFFIDGTWLFKVCSPKAALSYKTDSPDYPFSDITKDRVDKTKKVVFAKEKFTGKALDAGYSDMGVLRPEIKKWMIPELEDGSYQEK